MSRSNRKSKPHHKKTKNCVYQRNYDHQQKNKKRKQIVQEIADKISDVTMDIHSKANIHIDLQNILPKQYKITPRHFRIIKRNCFPKPSSKDGKGIQGNGLATNNHRLMFDSKPEQGKTYCMNHKLICPKY